MPTQPPERRIVTEATLTDYLSENPELVDGVTELVVRRDIVRAADVRRIVASTDPNVPLEDGDLLLVYEPAAPIFDAFTDFAAGIDDWTVQYLTTYGWAVVDEPAATGGKVVRTQGASGSARRGLTWDVLEGRDDNVDVEIVARIRTTQPATYSAAGPGLLVRTSGTDATRNAYYAVAYNGKVSVFRFVDGVYSEVPGAVGDFAYTAGAWYWMRLRAEGDRVKVKAWADGAAEPSGWIVDTAVPAPVLGGGSAGLYALSGANYVHDFDVAGVAADGGTAPTAPEA